MENPHESIQSNIISRIVTNMDRLNNNVLSMNQELIKTNKNLNSLKNLGELLENYHNTVQYNLEVSGNKQKPLWKAGSRGRGGSVCYLQTLYTGIQNHRNHRNHRNHWNHWNHKFKHSFHIIYSYYRQNTHKYTVFFWLLIIFFGIFLY